MKIETSEYYLRLQQENTILRAENERLTPECNSWKTAAYEAEEILKGLLTRVKGINRTGGLDA